MSSRTTGRPLGSAARRAFVEGAMRQGAAIAFYATLSLAPFLLLMATVLFGLLVRALPDRRVPWRVAMRGGFLAAAPFQGREIRNRLEHRPGSGRGRLWRGGGAGRADVVDILFSAGIPAGCWICRGTPQVATAGGRMNKRAESARLLSNAVQCRRSRAVTSHAIDAIAFDPYPVTYPQIEVIHVIELQQRPGIAAHGDAIAAAFDAVLAFHFVAH